MTPLIWGLAWLVVAILLGLLIGRVIRLADESQARELAKRSGRHPSTRPPSGPVR